jgi:hypothetical protein
MPASKHTKKARTAKQKRQWQHVRESAEARGIPTGQAIAMASGVIKRGAKKRKGKTR